MEERFFIPGSIIPVPLLERADAARVAAMAEVPGPLHDPPLEPRDEAVFLLTAAAEIEHALMVQYLYATYSVRVADPNRQQLEEVQGLLRQIAREEMGHFATVQNLLHLIGGPLHFNREHSPYSSTIYPFRFTLEPLTPNSLAKYVTAESPAKLPDELSKADEALLKKIFADATVANGGQQVQHVGRIFARLAHLFANELADNDFSLNTAAQQAKFPDWGYEPPTGGPGEPLIVTSFTSPDVATVRADAVAAIKAIGAQGEGFDPAPEGTESHFERFFDIYQRVSALITAEVTVTWPVAINPNTTSATEQPGMMDEVAVALETHASTGRINDRRARAWAHLFNLRYRLLLGQLAHFLRLDHDLYSGAAGPQLGDRTDRGLLLIGTFDEMRRLSKIAGKLVQLPKDNPSDPVHAGPPFELPYTLNLPDGEPKRWRMHLDASRAAVRLIREHLQANDTAADADGFLTDLVRRDTHAQTVMQSLAQGNGVPPDRLPTGFAKAVTILEEAVRGFTIGAHGNLWAGRTRDQFLAARFPGNRPPVNLTDGTVDRDPNNAPLVNMLENENFRMPLFRPPVPGTRIGYIRQWIADGCPDDSPPGQVGVTHERDPALESLPMSEPQPTSLSFEADIKGLFREQPDRVSMLFRFDLHRYEDVRDNATIILTRLSDGSMPCDSPWPPERIATFQQWIADGSRP